MISISKKKNIIKTNYKFYVKYTNWLSIISMIHKKFILKLCFLFVVSILYVKIFYF